jgi:hypothetical protein
MLTGVVPFSGTITPLVFKKILSKDIEYPENLSVEAIALIDGMLMIKPSERLGSPNAKCNM